MCPTPVKFISEDDPQKQPDDGMALCLSGGGYRAMIYHTGSIIRLNELGLLKKLNRVSSVSGGSITAAVLGMNWKYLDFDELGVATNLNKWFIQPLIRMASKTIDVKSVLLGLLPFLTINKQIIKAYDKTLFNGRTLQNLPFDSEGPRFVINVISVQTGVLFRFSKPYMADYKVGMFSQPTISLAQAVAASSAFPPILSPAVISLKGQNL